MYCNVSTLLNWNLRDYKLEGQIGLEPTIEEYVKEIGQCLKEMYRVLKKTGTLWLNVGDTYATHTSKRSGQFGKDIKAGFDDVYTQKRLPQTVPEKCLCLIPDRIRLLMVDMGWIIRNKNIWHKPNAMPSSVKDRFSNSYEDVIFAVKRQKYWFDLDAVREPHSPLSHPFGKDGSFDINQDCKTAPTWGIDGTQSLRGKKFHRYRSPGGKNPGDVWQICSEPYPKAHYATFPQKLVKKCLEAGCPKEICTKCGLARVRITKIKTQFMSGSGKAGNVPKGKHQNSVQAKSGDYDIRMGPVVEHQTIGWTDCGCGQGFRPGVALDMFAGSGTTGKVAIELGLDVILIDKKQEYLDQHAKKRIGGAQMPLIK